MTDIQPGQYVAIAHLSEEMQFNLRLPVNSLGIIKELPSEATNGEYLVKLVDGPILGLTTENFQLLDRDLLPALTPTLTRENLRPLLQQAIALYMSRLDDVELDTIFGMVRARALYRDANCPERLCDNCHKKYRGPALYCSHRCATADFHYGR